MAAADARIRAVGAATRRRITLAPGRATRAGVVAIAGLLLVLAGIASFSIGVAEIVGGVVLFVSAVGYLRGAD